jgi:hypothetical protein
LRLLPPLNLPPFDYRLKRDGQKNYIFDTIRKKYIRLTPEEWVRQHVIHWLCHYHGVAPGLIGVEKPLMVNGLPRRTDITAADRDGNFRLLVECKAPDIPLQQTVAEQVLRYNMAARIPYIWITNGIDHFLFERDAQTGQYQRLHALPSW